MTKPTTPRGLGARAKKLWSDMTGPYEFRPDELVLLEDACREVDVVDRLERDLKRTGLWVKGSMGQDVANPMIALLAQHRSTLARLLKQLDLPDEQGGVERPGAGERSS